MGRATNSQNLIRYLCRIFHPLLVQYLVCTLSNNMIKWWSIVLKRSWWGFYCGWQERLNSTNSSTWRNSAFKISSLSPSLSFQTTALPMWLEPATRQNFLRVNWQERGSMWLLCRGGRKGELVLRAYYELNHCYTSSAAMVTLPLVVTTPRHDPLAAEENPPLHPFLYVARRCKTIVVILPLSESPSHVVTHRRYWVAVCGGNGENMLKCRNCLTRQVWAQAMTAWTGACTLVGHTYISANCFLHHAIIQ